MTQFLRIKIFVTAIFCIVALHAKAQLVINEISPSNDSVVKDEDGDSPDWIELYNGGSSAVSLGGYCISDNIGQPAKWVFPSGVNIQPSGFILLFASGKDRKKFFHHWETVVNAGNLWHYTKPFTEPDSNWRILPGFNDAFWSQGIGGFGYGDNDDNTILTPPVTSVYMRRVFTITDTADIASAVFNMDYDDAFVAYINGVEIARSNIGVNGTPVPFSTLALSEHEAKMYTGGAADQFFLDEAFLKSFLRNGNNVLAIQVHNVTSGSSDMTSLAWLSLGIKSASSNYGPVPAWFNLNSSSLHTNFKLAQNGGTLMLSSPSGAILDQFTVGPIHTDNSYGRKPNGASTYNYFKTPTPNASNNIVTGYVGYTADPLFSPDGGFFQSAQTLILSTPTPGGIIRYTLDGSAPINTSTQYSIPLNIDSTTVVRARTFHASLLEGNTVTNTFFISDSSSSSLPVISLSFPPALFFDTITGVYVKGPNAEANIPFFGANFWQEREVMVHIEYFDKQRQLGFEQDAGLEIYGNYSRSFPQKSMKLVAHEGYGNGSFDYQLFPSKDIHSFKQFILRNAGTDWNQAHMRDALLHTLALKPTNCDVMAYQPSIVYLNGKYWGVYNIREKINKHYLENNHGADPDSVDLLQYNGLVMNGSNTQFIQDGSFVAINDMSNATNFATAEALFDLENFADYFAVETWSENWDWLTNNVRYWRENKAGKKWRYILWDLDNGLGGQYSYVANSLDTNIHKSYDYTSILFHSLLNNSGYKKYFINRYADLLNTTFTPQNFATILYSLRDTVDGEMPRHFRRWGTGFNNPNWGLAGQGDFNTWRNYHLPEILTFCHNRQITARNHIEATFNLKKQVPVTLNVYPPNAGKVILNTITVEDMPWAGIYFDSVPVKITAVANPGFQFGFWQSGIIFSSPQNTASLTFNPDTADVFTAYFYGAPDTAKITFSEINYHAPDLADDADWVELHNYSAWDFDLSDYRFKDSQDGNFYAIPKGTVLHAGEYLVLCQDTIKFKTIHPTVTNYLGPWSFGLSSAGENIRLFDKDMNLCLSAAYSGGSPWPTTPNGQGRTLELLSPNGNLNAPYNWFAGCPGGSPGGPFVPCDNSGIDTPNNISDGNVAVYPNPVSENLFIEFNSELIATSSVTIELFDLSGRPVYRQDQIHEEQCIIQNNFAPGMYIYKISSSTGYHKTGKIIFE
jgi:hypothetical protein